MTDASVASPEFWVSFVRRRRKRCLRDVTGTRLRIALLAIVSSASAFLLAWWFGLFEVGKSAAIPSLAAYCGISGAYVGLAVWVTLLGHWLWVGARNLDDMTIRNTGCLLAWIYSIAAGLVVLNCVLSYGGVFSTDAIGAIDGTLKRSVGWGISWLDQLGGRRASTVTVIGNFLALMAIGSILVSTTCLSWIAGRTSSPATLSDCGRRLSELLYVTSVLLVVGTSTVFTLFRVAAEIRPKLPDGRLDMSTATAITLAAGALFSVFLVFIFLTVTAIVQDRLNELADEAAKAFDAAPKPDGAKMEYFDRKKWAESFGFEDGGQQKLVFQVMASLAPLATALASKLLGS